MTYLLLSFVAGILTVLAPCVLPLLPIIIGGSVSGSSKIKPFIISISLVFSIIVFTLLLKVSTAFIEIPDIFWKWFSGGVIILFGLTILFHHQWDWLMSKLNFGSKSQQLLQKSGKKEGILGMVLVGASLGPVFASCSPAYLLIVGTVFQQDYLWGLINLVVYSLGLGIVLLAVSIFGRKITQKLQAFADPKGYFKKILGLIFILIGIGIISGYDKKVEAWFIEKGWGNAALEWEQEIVDQVRE